MHIYICINCNYTNSLGISFSLLFPSDQSCVSNSVQSAVCYPCLNIAQCHLQCIQRTQNAVARIITHTRRYEHITRDLRQLHWLTIQEWIELKVLCLTYKALHNMAPLYLSQFLSQKIVPRQLSSPDITIKTAYSLAVFTKRLMTCILTYGMWESIRICMWYTCQASPSASFLKKGRRVGTYITVNVTMKPSIK